MKTRFIFLSLVFALALAGLWLLALTAQPARAASFIVDTVVDEADYDCFDGDCSLRDAIETSASGDAVEFAAALSGQTITLTIGQLDIDHDLTIDASGLAEPVKISGGNAFRVIGIHAGANVTLNSLNILDGYSDDGFGGGGLNNDGLLTAMNCTVSNSATPDNGGGIFNSGTLTMTNGVVSDNSSDSGRGGGMSNPGVATLTNVTFDGNTGYFDGGGVYNQYGALTLTDVTFSGNATGGYGGGVDNSYGDLSLTNVFFNGNASWNGAGLATDGGNLALVNVTFDGNSAWGSGGGIFILSGSLNMNGGALIGNTASGNGGGILNSDVMALTNVTLSGNSAAYGGGIRNQGNLTMNGSSLQHNSAQWGGGMDNYWGSTTVDGSNFYSNTADNAGGGVTTSAAMTVTDSTFQENAANNGAGIENHDGGALFVQQSDFLSNTAGVEGGGMANYGSTARITGCVLSGNTADVSGGGIFNDGSGMLIVENSAFSENAAVGVLSGYGGAIQNNHALAVSGSTFTGNTALYNGGAIESWGGALTITGTSFISNSANAGGAVVNNMNSVMTVTESAFQWNSADNGGAILNDNNSVLNVTVTGFYSNTASSLGGGIVNISGTITIHESELNWNTALYGGGIQNQSLLTATLMSIGHNSAEWGGGIDNGGAGRLVVVRAGFGSNTALYYGGGIYNAATLTAARVDFQNHSADAGAGLYNDGAARLENTTFDHNGATNMGGGILNNSGALTLTNVTLNDNWAAGGGGLGSGATLYFSNTIIANSPSGGDCFSAGVIAANSHNLVEDGGCNVAFSGDPSLGPHQLNGGNTSTCALLPNSPAIDAGDAAACPAIDQRGQARDDWACDLGAFELTFTDSPSVTMSIPGAGVYTFGPTRVKVEVVSAGLLDSLTITKTSGDHPGRSGSAGGAGVGWGEYFSLTPNGGANGTFTATLTLPSLFAPDSSDKVCRYVSGTTWDCAADSFSSTPFDTITREGVTAFSDWAAGNNVGPTAVRLASLRSVSGAASALPVALLACLFVCLAALLYLQRRRHAAH